MEEIVPDPDEPEYPFPLGIVTNLAAILLLGKPNRFASEDGRLQAADEPVRLLEACQNRLARHWEIKAREQPEPNHRAVTERERETEAKAIEKRFGNPVRFAPGFRFITDQPTETKAVGW